MPRTQLRHRVFAVLPVLALALLAGCGGGKSEEDVEALLDRAFKQSIKSADVKIDAELRIDGLAGFDKPVRLEAQGPYIGGDKQLPKADIDLKIGAQDAGQTVSTGFLSTGDRAFVKFGGEFYEQPKADVARANRELAKSAGNDRGSLPSDSTADRPVADAFGYRVSYDGSTVTTDDPGMPDGLGRLVARLGALVERLEKG